MNLLLDTHILLWALAKPKQLPDRALSAIQQAHNVFFTSGKLMGDWHLSGYPLKPGQYLVEPFVVSKSNHERLDRLSFDLLRTSDQALLGVPA